MTVLYPNLCYYVVCYKETSLYLRRCYNPGVTITLVKIQNFHNTELKKFKFLNLIDAYKNEKFQA